MPEYTKRPCFNCGIRLPQPEMNRMEIDRFGVRGNELPLREEWVCTTCVPVVRQRNPSLRAMKIAEHIRLIKAREKDEKKDQAGRARWHIELEQRRLANLAKKSTPRES